MAAKLEAWLALTIEDPIEPDLPICDPHHHFWDRPDDRYLLDELLQDVGGGHRVVQTVFIECRSVYRQDGPTEMRPVAETEFVQGIAAQNAANQRGSTNVAAGIVSYADLSLGAAVAPVLEAHAAAGQGRFRGIRHSTSWDASPEVNPGRGTPQGLLLDSKFREGIACLQQNGLSYDALVFHPQLNELADLAQAFPDLTIILNHVGRPLGIGPYSGRREEVLPVWKQGIDAVAACPNVVVKVGGLGNTISGFDWHQRNFPPASIELARAAAPYYLYCIEKFGADRCMFESNFPVDKLSCSYNVVWNAFKRLSKDLSKEERSALFHDTAVRAYRLSDSQ